jgi:DNA invertase Pin-like site-specific DNA recombinase
LIQVNLAGLETAAHGRLILTVLGGLPEFELELVRTRTGEGRERAKAPGSFLVEAEAITPSAEGGFGAARGAETS